MDSTSEAAAKESSGEGDQIAQLKSYLESVTGKQEELKRTLATKRAKAATARRLSTQLGEDRYSLIKVVFDENSAKDTEDDGKKQAAAGMQRRLEDYSHSVEELEKELNETTKLVNDISKVLYLAGLTAPETATLATCKPACKPAT